MQVEFGHPDPALDRPERDTEQTGNLNVRMTIPIGKTQNLAFGW